VTAWKIALTAISLLTGAELKGIIRPKGKNKTIKVKKEQGLIFKKTISKLPPLLSINFGKFSGEGKIRNC
jgi:sRNA-binding regulator protein Hfq